MLWNATPHGRLCGGEDPHATYADYDGDIGHPHFATRSSNLVVRSPTLRSGSRDLPQEFDRVHLKDLDPCGIPARCKPSIFLFRASRLFSFFSLKTHSFPVPLSLLVWVGHGQISSDQIFFVQKRVSVVRPQDRFVPLPVIRECRDWRVEGEARCSAASGGFLHCGRKTRKRVGLAEVAPLGGVFEVCPRVFCAVGLSA